MSIEVRRFPTASAAAEALADLLAERLSAGGRAVLGGGSTPLEAYRKFGRADILWSRVQLIPSDERCLPEGHAERNDRLISEAIGRSKITLHRFPAELGPEAAAAQMQEAVRDLLPFDVAALGLGEDGHTASLFPGHPLDPEALTVAVRHSPKPPPERVSLGLGALSGSQLVVYLVTGVGKREALAGLLGGADLPPGRIRAQETLVLCDEAAHPEGSA